MSKQSVSPVNEVRKLPVSPSVMLTEATVKLVYKHLYVLISFINFLFQSEQGVLLHS